MLPGGPPREVRCPQRTINDKNKRTDDRQTITKERAIEPLFARAQHNIVSAEGSGPPGAADLPETSPKQWVLLIRLAPFFLF